MQNKEPEKLSDAQVRMLMTADEERRFRLSWRFARENLYEKRRAKYAKQSGIGARECARRVRNA